MARKRCPAGGPRCDSRTRELHVHTGPAGALVGYLDHPAYVDVDGPIPARRERWLHVEHADGGRVLMHPSNLEAVRPLLEVLAEHVAQVTAGRAVTTA